MWEGYKKGYKAYLQLERSLSDNSVEAYLRDVEKLTEYLLANDMKKTPGEIQLKDLQHFIQWIAELGMPPSSVLRSICAMIFSISSKLKKSGNALFVFGASNKTEGLVSLIFSNKQ